MKKLEAILRKCDFTDKLLGLREKQVRTSLTAARNDIEEQAAKAEIDYERLCKRLGDKEVSNYKSILNEMIKAKEITLNAKATLEVIKGIEADLDSAVTPVKAE